MTDSEQNLVHDWILHAKTFWAATRASELSRSDPEAALAFIQEVRRRDSSSRVLANLAAGPLEDLLVYHGADVIDRVEALAAADPAFRQLLAGVWQNAIRGDVWQRIRALVPPEPGT